jgi:hypothetical protein
MLLRKLQLLFCFLPVFNFLHSQDSTNYKKLKTEQIQVKDTTNPVANNWASFISVGAGEGYCATANAIGLAGTVSLAYKSHLFSLSGGGVYTSRDKLLTSASYFEYGYMGFLFGEKIQYKHIYVSLSTGFAYTNLEYSVNNLKTDVQTYQYLKSGVSIPVELKLFALSYKSVGIGLGASKIFILNSKYAPLMFTATLVLGNWTSKK